MSNDQMLLNEFERSLMHLEPSPSLVDPLRAAFEAGQRVGRATMVRWRWTAAVASLAAAVLATASLVGHRQLASPTPPPPITADVVAVNPSLIDAWRLRDELLARGLDALPSTPLSPAPAAF